MDPQQSHPTSTGKWKDMMAFHFPVEVGWLYWVLSDSLSPKAWIPKQFGEESQNQMLQKAPYVSYSIYLQRNSGLAIDSIESVAAVVSSTLHQGLPNSLYWALRIFCQSAGVTPHQGVTGSWFSSFLSNLSLFFFSKCSAERLKFSKS